MRCGAKNDKVSVCHGGNTLCINSSDIVNHLAHGDKLGACGVSSIIVKSKTEQETNEGLRVTVSPNPTQSYFTLYIASADRSNAVKVRVVDAAGRIVETKSIGAQQKVQVGGGYLPGLYYAEMVQGAKRVIVKLFKQTR